MHTNPESPSIPDTALRWTTAAVVLTLFLAAMDSTVVAVLLPKVERALGHSGLYAWIMSGYLLAVTLVAPFAGALGDRLGERRMLQIAILLFATASGGSALAPSMPLLILARVLQGLGGGMIIVLAYALLGTLYGPERRGSMQGMLSSVWGVAAVVGPLCGAALAAWLGWRAVFWFNLPLAVVCIAVLRLTDRDQTRTMHAVHIDIASQLLLGVVTIGVMLALSQTALRLPATVFIVLLGFTTLAGLALVQRAWRRPGTSPIPTAFFSRPELLSSLCLLFLSSGGLYGSVTLLPLYLQHGDTQIFGAAGTVALAAVGWATGSAVCGKLLERIGYRFAGLLGAALLIAGSVMLALHNSASSDLAIWGGEALLGFGTGFVATTSLMLAQNLAPAGHIGAYTAATQFLRNLGAAVGINALAAMHLANSGLQGNAYHTAFVGLAVAMTLVVPLALVLPQRYLALAEVG
jgi:MFS family permease